MKRLAILGSTGSIGQNALRVVAGLPGEWEVTALAAGRNAALLAEQVRAWEPAWAGAADHETVAAARRLLAAGSWVPKRRQPEWVAGAEGYEAIARTAPIVVNALVGAAGLGPSLAAADAGARLALANKESLVVGGALLRARVRRGGGTLLPIDSEHSGLLQCLAGGRRDQVARVLITASGGPLLRHADWRQATPAEVLAHPVWPMGARITTDSATLVNKAFEVMEAHWLFDLAWHEIEVLVHPQAIVHALVEWCDGSVLAQLSPPDMRLPIQVALTWPERAGWAAPRLDLAAAGGLAFERVDETRFPAFRLALDAGRAGGLLPAVLNAADETLVALFHEGRLGLGEVVDTLERVLAAAPAGDADDLDRIMVADAWAREEARRVAVGA